MRFHMNVYGFAIFLTTGIKVMIYERLFVNQIIDITEIDSSNKRDVMSLAEAIGKPNKRYQRGHAC